MGHTILLVDDSATVRSLIRVHLMGRGYDFVEACDGEAGLALARSSNVHLIVSDLNMPRMDGMAFIQKLRADANPHLRTVPIVVLSSEKSAKKEKLMAMGANAFHPKPVSSTGILATVERLLGRRSSPPSQGRAEAT